MVLGRREFLKKAIRSTGLAVAGGKVFYDSIHDLKDFLNKDKIFNELPGLVKKIYNLRTYNFNNEEVTQDSWGSIFRVDDDLYTCYHNIEDMPYIAQTPYGAFPIKDAKLKEKKLTINGVETKILNYNEEMDSAILEMNEELDKAIKPIPCRLGKVELGDKVYMIGNPRVGGVFVKSGLVGRLKPFKLMAGDVDPMTKGSFAVGMPAIPGDSGSPVINEDLELVGVAHAAGDTVRTLATYIKHYTDLLEICRRKIPKLNQEVKK